jgi:lysophospholipase L1-like esterase
MRPWVAVLLLAGCATVEAPTIDPEASPQDGSEVQPLERTDENSRIAHLQLVEKAQTGRIDLYFAGDSITRRWGATDYPEFLAHFRQSFFGWNAANFGWGGDTTRNILWRLGEGELAGVHPKVIVLLAGTNDIGNRAPAEEAGQAGEDRLAAETSRGIGAILDRMRELAPDATIILMGVFPRNDNTAAQGTIRNINRRLRTYADGDAIRYLDIGDQLADSEGRLRDGMSDDGLHLSLGGYEIWAGALRPILLDLLGTPSTGDLAPPPTGNPAAG